MNIFDRLKVARKAFKISNSWQPQTLENLDRYIETLFITGDGATELNFTSFFSGVFQISQTIGSCPLRLYQKVGEGKEPYKEHPVYKLITHKANEYTDAYHFKETLEHHAIVWGNGYAKIERDGAYRPRALWIMQPHLTRVEIEEDGRPVYIYRHPRTRKEEKYEWDQVFHLAGFGYDGIKGYSLINLHRTAINLGLSQQAFSERFVNNGVRLSGALKHPGRLGDQTIERLKKSIRDQYAGSANAGKFMVLEEGIEFQQFSMPLDDAQFLESRLFQVGEMARILNIPVYKLKDYSHATYSNVEQLQIEYRTDTIRPWAERWESAINTQLLTPQQQEKAFAEFDLNAISRGDMATEYKAYHDGRYGGYLNANEIRTKLGYNPIVGDVGEVYWMPTNMTDAAKQNNQQTNNEQSEVDNATSETTEG